MLISVLIPVYNAEKYLARCLDSIIRQSYEEWEIIAVDDGSKDGSYQILRSYADRDMRIIAMTKENEGPGLTRNRALDMASGDYIVFVDSDDYIESTYFEKIVNCVQQEKSDVIFIDVIQERPDGTVICKEKMSDFSGYSKRDLVSFQMCGTMPWGGVRKAVKKELLDKYHIRYTEDTVGEEALYSFQLLHNAEKISFISDTLYHYVNYPSSQSKAGGENPWNPIVIKLKRHLEENNLIEDYRTVINAFAYSAMIVWLLRYSSNHSLLSTLKEFKKKRKLYFKEFGWNVATKYLRKEAKFLLPVIRCNALLPVVIAAKLRK